MTAVGDFIVEMSKRFLDDEPQKFFGVTTATVLDNVDVTMRARVQISIPWAPSIKPWARVASPMAGFLRGAYLMPQIGDEVLVSFVDGDLRSPFVLGSLWNQLDRPPIVAPTDAVTRRFIRSPLGHEIEFDEVTQAVTIRSSTRQKIKLDPLGVEIEAAEGLATISVGVDGSITLTAATSISLKAPTIEIEGVNVKITGAATTDVVGGAKCSIKGALVGINDP